MRDAMAVNPPLVSLVSADVCIDQLPVGITTARQYGGVGDVAGVFPVPV